jgi:hypothetical protein
MINGRRGGGRSVEAIVPLGTERLTLPGDLGRISEFSKGSRGTGAVQSRSNSVNLSVPKITIGSIDEQKLAVTVMTMMMMMAS